MKKSKQPLTDLQIVEIRHDLELYLAGKIKFKDICLKMGCSDYAVRMVYNLMMLEKLNIK